MVRFYRTGVKCVMEQSPTRSAAVHAPLLGSGGLSVLHPNLLLVYNQASGGSQLAPVMRGFLRNACLIVHPQLSAGIKLNAGVTGFASTTLLFTQISRGFAAATFRNHPPGPLDLDDFGMQDQTSASPRETDRKGGPTRRMLP